MSGYVAVILFIMSNGLVHMMAPVHFEKKSNCDQYAQTKMKDRMGAILRHGRCVPVAYIRYNGDLLVEYPSLID